MSIESFYRVLERMQETTEVSGQVGREMGERTTGLEDTIERILTTLREERKQLGVRAVTSEEIPDPREGLRVYEELLRLRREAGNPFAALPNKILFFGNSGGIAYTPATGVSEPVTGTYGANPRYWPHAGLVYIPSTAMNTRDLPHSLCHELCHAEMLATKPHFTVFWRRQAFGDMMHIQQFEEGSNVACTVAALAPAKKCYPLAYDLAIERLDILLSQYLHIEPDVQSGEVVHRPYPETAGAVLTAAKGVQCFDEVFAYVAARTQ